MTLPVKRQSVCRNSRTPNPESPKLISTKPIPYCIPRRTKTHPVLYPPSNKKKRSNTASNGHTRATNRCRTNRLTQPSRAYSNLKPTSSYPANLRPLESHINSLAQPISLVQPHTPGPARLDHAYTLSTSASCIHLTRMQTNSLAHLMNPSQTCIQSVSFKPPHTCEQAPAYKSHTCNRKRTHRTSGSQYNPVSNLPCTDKKP